MRDEGIGIPEDKVDKLFIDFGKLDDPNQCNVEGTGLGLSISKRIVETMNGQVQVLSKVNRGSSFIITMRTKIALPRGIMFSSSGPSSKSSNGSYVLNPRPRLRESLLER